MTEIQRARSGSPYEVAYGFSRGLRAGDRVSLAGTAPIWPDGACDPDAGKQARRCFEILLQALGELGGQSTDVIRTRMYIVDPSDADAVGAAHREAVGQAAPAATMVVVAGLLDPRWKVEIEAEAVLAS